MLAEPPSTRHRHNPSTLKHAPPHRREPSAHCDVRAHTADGCVALGPSCNLGCPMSTRPPPSPPPSPNSIPVLATPALTAPALTATALNASTHAATGRALTALADHVLD